MKNIPSRIKRLISQKILRRLGYKVSKIGPYGVFDFESFLYRYIAVTKHLTFLQIGANDGIMNDPIYDFIAKNKSHVGGFVLEPLPDTFQKLVANYADCPKIKPLNLAIHNDQSEMLLHRVKPQFEPLVSEFARGIASFDASHWKKTKLSINPSYIEEVRVRCISLAEFIKTNSITNLDLLLIDTEGYDYEILMSIDFDQIKPSIIRFEHGLRDGIMPVEKFVNICHRLNLNGYQIFAESYDATAYLLKPAELNF